MIECYLIKKKISERDGMTDRQHLKSGGDIEKFDDKI